MTKKPKDRGPTPDLGVPRANRHLFTYEETKLLDQITTEICEAWAKDLKTIRECHKETLETVKKLADTRVELSRMMSTLESNGFFPELKKALEDQYKIFLFMEDVRQKTFQTHEQVVALRDAILKMEAMKKVVNDPKRWWQIWR